MNVIRHHREKVLAQKTAHASADAGDATLEGRNAYELMLAQLQTDSTALRSMQSIEKRIEMKGELVPKYDAYVAGILAADENVQDDVLMTQLVWRIDIGAYEGAYDIALHALKHALVMPYRFKRTLPTLLAEEFSDPVIHAENTPKTEEASEDVPIAPKPLPSLGLLTDLLAQLKEQDMPDEVRAKLHKAIAFSYETAGTPDDLAEAQPHYERALQLDQKSGVKKRLEQLVRKTKTITK
ncbi:MAG: phage terminase small subunit [Parvibaculaceae bacterium]|nr:phage terminase small subunit [Parvibaculaceae bacterium]